jgi:hypothetical protein
MDLLEDTLRDDDDDDKDDDDEDNNVKNTEHDQMDVKTCEVRKMFCCNT